MFIGNDGVFCDDVEVWWVVNKNDVVVGVVCDWCNSLFKLFVYF